MTNHEHCGNQWSLCCDIVERVKKQLDFTKQKVDGKMEDKIEQHDLLQDSRRKEMKPAKCSECGEEFETSKLLLDHGKSCLGK